MGKYAEEKVEKRVKERLGRYPDASPYPLAAIEDDSTLVFASPSNSQCGNFRLGSLPRQLGTNWEDTAIPRFYADVSYLGSHLLSILACSRNLKVSHCPRDKSQGPESLLHF